MNLFSNCSKPTDYIERRYLHNLKRGDHVVRWTRIVIYPIQVHGIVLSASDDVVTIVDFGLTASSSSSLPSEEEKGQKVEKNVTTSASASALDEKMNDNNNNNDNGSNDPPLEEMINHEDRAMMKSCEKHRHEIMGPDRINILVLTDEKDIKQWKKVQYDNDGDGKDTNKKGKFRWFWNKDNQNGDDKKKAHDEIDQDDDSKMKSCIEKNEDENNEENNEINSIQYQSLDNDLLNGSETENKKQRTGEQTIEDENIEDDNDVKEASSLEDSKKNNNISSAEVTKNTQPSPKKVKKNSKINHETKKPQPPILSRADPDNIVLARVRFLVSKPHVLPPHNIFFSNSECIAVWCKTGVWSTFQASFYLHSTAAGNFKTAVTAAAAVGGTTVTTTVPASGVAGWFGMTTTATVSLVSVQPWLIPALAGYGIVAVGTPYLFLRKCHDRWTTATTILNDKFWGELDADVYVEAIKSWSRLE